jgi:hypothetical protein
VDIHNTNKQTFIHKYIHKCITYTHKLHITYLRIYRNSYIQIFLRTCVHIYVPFIHTFTHRFVIFICTHIHVLRGCIINYNILITWNVQNAWGYFPPVLQITSYKLQLYHMIFPRELSTRAKIDCAFVCKSLIIQIGQSSRHTIQNEAQLIIFFLCMKYLQFQSQGTVGPTPIKQPSTSIRILMCSIQFYKTVRRAPTKEQICLVCLSAFAKQAFRHSATSK